MEGAAVDLLSKRIDDLAEVTARAEERTEKRLDAADATRTRHTKALAHLIRTEFQAAEARTSRNFSAIARRLDAGEARFSHHERRLGDMEAMEWDRRTRRDERRRWLGLGRRIVEAATAYRGAIIAALALGGGVWATFSSPPAPQAYAAPAMPRAELRLHTLAP